MPSIRPRPLRRLTLLFCVVAVVAALLGYVAGHWVRSPEQVLADARPPAPTSLTAAVTSGQLTEGKVFQGKVDTAVRYTLHSSDTGSVVTSIDARPGIVVHSGDPLYTLNDRPVFAILGRVPLYRELHYGDSGPDVVRVQVALRDLGLLDADPDGHFGALTEAAVERLYERWGFAAPTESTAAESVEDPSGETADETSAERGATPRTPPGSHETIAAKPPVQHVVLPQTALVPAPALPATVLTVRNKIGEPGSSEPVTLIANRIVVRADLDPYDAGTLKVGDRMSINVASSGRSLGGGTVQAIGTPHQVGEEGLQTTVTIAPKHAIAVNRVGSLVRLVSVAKSATRGLVVPLASVNVAADGTETVTRIDSTGDKHPVEIKVIAQSDGAAQVKAKDGRLEVGDQVWIGVR